MLIHWATARIRRMRPPCPGCGRRDAWQWGRKRRRKRCLACRAKAQAEATP